MRPLNAEARALRAEKYPPKPKANFDDEKGYESFIWKEDWPQKRCGAASLKSWPGK